MKILYGRCFGIGNAVMSVPAIRALRLLYPLAEIHVLTGSTPDDFGAIEILDRLVPLKVVDRVLRSVPGISEVYDLAIMAIPFDGRWRNGEHFSARDVRDMRTRPDPATRGLISWKKHEVEYQMDNVRGLGYSGKIPPIDIFPKSQKQNSVYLGVGYKKDPSEFWKVKHYGNENFITFLNELFSRDSDVLVYATGDIADLQMTLNPIRMGVHHRFRNRLFTSACSLRESIDIVSRCKTYFGNDTGMAHVAAACGCECIVSYFMEGSIVKNRPWGTDERFLLDRSLNRTFFPAEDVFHLRAFQA